MKKCTICNQEKDESSFYFRNKSKPEMGRRSACSKCEYTKVKTYKKLDKYKKLNEKSKKKNHLEKIHLILEYLLNHPCVDCGESNPIVLEFDHVSGNKVESVMYMVKIGSSWNRILEEIEKCEVRCSNCHTIKTSKENSRLLYKIYMKMI